MFEIKGLEFETTSEKKEKKENLLPKLFWPTARKNCSSDQENFLKFEAEGWEFVKFFSFVFWKKLGKQKLLLKLTNL